MTTAIKRPHSRVRVREAIDAHIADVLKARAAMPRPAVITTFHGPTDTKGARIKAVHVNTKRAVFLSYDYGLDGSQNHERAARHVLYSNDASECTNYARAKLLVCSVDGGGYVFMVGD